MSAAKKAAKKSTSARVTSTSQDKGEIPEKSKSRYKLNPLPEEEVGPRLLVRLQAEKVMKKLKLKEKWEDPLGWDFDELCAVLASSILGHGCMTDREKVLLRKVTKFRNDKTIREIEQLAKPMDFSLNLKGKLNSELYDTALILGIGTSKFSVGTNPELSQTGQLCDALSRAFNVPISIVDGRVWERAKRNVTKRYSEHLEKAAERAKRVGSLATKKPATKRVARPERSNMSMLREVIGRLAMEGTIPAITGQTPQPLANAAIMRAGFKRLDSKRPGS